jgi:hypothetical protein
MSATTIDLPGTLDWLGLLPPGWEPDGLRTALEAREQALDLHADCTARADAASASLGALVVAGSDHEQVQAAALDQVVARAIVGALPAVPTVPESYGEQIVECIAGWFREHAVNLGSPPLILAEARHFLEMHAGQRGPRMTDREAEVLPLFEQVAAEVFKVRTQVASLCRPMDSEAVGDRVRAWHGFRAQYEAHWTLVDKTAGLVAAVDADRLRADWLHRCPLWGGAHCGPLLAVEDFPPPGPWTEVRSMRDGIPARPALIPAGAL